MKQNWEVDRICWSCVLGAVAFFRWSHLLFKEEEEEEQLSPIFENQKREVSYQNILIWLTVNGWSHITLFLHGISLEIDMFLEIIILKELSMTVHLESISLVQMYLQIAISNWPRSGKNFGMDHGMLNISLYLLICLAHPSSPFGYLPSQ